MNKQLLNKKDYKSSNEVRWCPGCGDYAILATMQKTMADLGLNRENTVFVSGIGCAARFVYYMNTYGLHTIHGRAPAFATGIKLSNPRLNVFLVTGDGDGLSIGASHLLHLFRRNINLTVLLFNNQIYGLTKGQYSPTSKKGLIAKSTPFGSLEKPVNPISFALAANARFVARSIDTNAAHLSQTIKSAIEHKGTSFIEILQTCVVFHDSAFNHMRSKDSFNKNVLMLKPHEPMLYNNGKLGLGIDYETLMPKVLDAQGHDKEKLLIHKPYSYNNVAHLLSNLSWPDYPTPIGIFRAIKDETYEEHKEKQDASLDKNDSFNDLLRGNNAWQV